ncbi:MAG: hypothetical protein DSY59_00385 [Persephonella sp.]|nr:MAG: hypothetical protein DSY59_00385 [Persephonella sp.]
MINSIKSVLESSANLSNLSKSDFELLNEYKDILSQWTDGLVKTFYDTIFTFDKTASIPHKGERAKLEKTLTDWYMDIISGELTGKFWMKQWYVGLIHIYRNVDNKYMVAMMGKFQEEFMKKTFENFDKDLALKISSAFNRITNTILAVIVEGYINMYIKSLEGMTGINKEILDRMVAIESKKLFFEYKS